MTAGKTSRIDRILKALKAKYGNVTCALTHQNAFELLAATILSAQCTDKRVNMVTPHLFAKYPSPAELAVAPQTTVEEIIRSTGFYHNKAKSLIGMAKALVEKHDGRVPQSLEQLIELPGVARKTANVVMGTAFGVASGVVVDTHVSRISRLLDLTQHDDPVRIEQDLCAILPQSEWINFSHRLIHLGREICIARRPQCGTCPLQKDCPSAHSPKAAPKQNRSQKN